MSKFTAYAFIVDLSTPSWEATPERWSGSPVAEFVVVGIEFAEAGASGASGAPAAPAVDDIDVFNLGSGLIFVTLISCESGCDPLNASSIISVSNTSVNAFGSLNTSWKLSFNIALKLLVCL